jgi:hypothetical protein
LVEVDAQTRPTTLLTVERFTPIAALIPQPSPAPPELPVVQGPGQPLQFLNHLLQSFGATRLQSLADGLPAVRILVLAGLAGVALRLKGATLGAINEIPLLGGLLELVGLVALLHVLARHALKQQKRAELLERIRTLRNDLLT